jgi:uncharacterized protein (TIGR03083 family)
MDTARLLECTEADYLRLRSVVPGLLARRVPSCPDWSVADLVRHVAQVYSHKVEMMRHGREPEVWPPPGFAEADPLGLLDAAHQELTAEFAARSASEPTPTWYSPDQSVGFWIRRMAHETAIHRIDAELGAGTTIAPVPADLAVDGIDELLKIFVGWACSQWPGDFAAALRGSPSRRFLVRADPAAGAPGRTWLVETASGGLMVADGPDGSQDEYPAPDVTVSGTPEAVYRWAWHRGEPAGPGQPSPVSISGDQRALIELQNCITGGTQ